MSEDIEDSGNGSAQIFDKYSQHLSHKLLYFEFSVEEPLGLDLKHENLEVNKVVRYTQADELGVVRGAKVVKIGNSNVHNFEEFVLQLKQICNEKQETVLILFSMPDCNKTAYNKIVYTFRFSVFKTFEEDGLSISGNLMKRGSNVMNPWQKRYFVAENHYLRYYKNQEESINNHSCLAAIDLDLCDIKDAHKNMFSLVFKIENSSSDHEKLTFKAKDKREANKWVNYLRRLHKEYGQQQIASIHDSDDDGYDSTDDSDHVDPLDFEKHAFESLREVIEEEESPVVEPEPEPEPESVVMPAVSSSEINNVDSDIAAEVFTPSEETHLSAEVLEDQRKDILSEEEASKEKEITANETATVNKSSKSAPSNRNRPPPPPPTSPPPESTAVCSMFC